MRTVSPVTVIWIIARRELVRFMRQPARIIAAIGTPAFMWLFLASGFAESLQPQHLNDHSYSLFLLPGMMTLVAVFASIFASISIIEDRAGGWLQTVMVSPAPRWSIALGRIAGGSIVASTQALLLLAALPFIGQNISALDIVIVCVAVILTATAITAVGLALAWMCESTASFHSIMNLVLMPMWLLSGAFFPIEGAASWLRFIMAINPLSWCTQAIRAPLTGDTQLTLLLAPLAFAIIAIAAAVLTITTPSKRLAVIS